MVNRPVYAAIGVTVNGERDIDGLWPGDGHEGATFWLSVLTEIKNRGVQDCCILVCDGLKGLPDTAGIVAAVWPLTLVQTCVIHLLRNSLRYTARQDWDKIARDLKPVYTAPTEQAAAARFAEFAETWGALPGDRAALALGWAEFVPFLDHDTEDTAIRQDHLHDQRDRVPERPLPPRGPSARPLPHRASRPEMPLPRHPITGPHRAWQGTLGHPPEGSAQCVRHHLRGPPGPQHHQLTPGRLHRRSDTPAARTFL